MSAAQAARTGNDQAYGGRVMRKKQAGKSKMGEVARRVGVSLSTVSRALAGSALISEETRRLVHEAADSLNYKVDATGSSLRTGQTRTVGVIIPLAHAAKQNLSDPFFLEILGALADELSSGGYSMLLQKVTEDPSEWISTITRAGTGMMPHTRMMVSGQ